MSDTLRLETPRVFGPLCRRARYKGGYGGRGSGKSHFFAEHFLEYAIETPGLRGVCIREVQRSLRFSSKILLEDKIKKHRLGRYFDIQRDEIRVHGDGVIVFEGMQNHTAESIKSLEAFDVALVEEAQNLSRRSLELLTPTIRKPGSELWFAWNPRHRTDPVDVFFRGPHRRPSALVIEANYGDNPWFPEDLREDMEWDRGTDPDKYAHVWAGGYLELSEARVFKNWRVEEFETPADAVFYLGSDWGYAVDPSALVRCFVDGHKLYIDAEAYMVGCEIDYLPFLFGGMHDKVLQQLNAEAYAALQRQNIEWPGIPGSRNWIVTADSARPETIAYLKRHGFPRTQPSIKGPGSVEEGVEFLRSFEIVVHPRCKHVIDELTFYKFKEDPKTGDILPILEDKKNHVIDALRYAIERLRRRRKRAGTF